MSKSGNFVGTTLGILVCLFVVVFMAAFGAGWVMNIIQLFSCDFTEVDSKEVLKIVGVVFAPIGAVMGWIG